MILVVLRQRLLRARRAKPGLASLVSAFNRRPRGLSQSGEDPLSGVAHLMPELFPRDGWKRLQVSFCANTLFVDEVGQSFA